MIDFVTAAISAIFLTPEKEPTIPQRRVLGRLAPWGRAGEGIIEAALSFVETVLMKLHAHLQHKKVAKVSRRQCQYWRDLSLRQ